MKLPPREVLASYPPANYINPETRGNSLIIVNGVFLGLMTVGVILRIFTRTVVRRWFGWDDVFIILAYLFTIGLNIAIDIGVNKSGWNRHVYDIPIASIGPSLKLAFWAKLLFANASFFTMLSLLAFYYRLIADTHDSGFRIALHLAVAFNTACYLSVLFAQIFICYPVKDYWTFPEPPGAKCLEEGPVTLASGCLKTFADLLITTLPIPLILRMNMQKRQRYGVAALLALGYIASIAGIVRTYFTYRTFYQTYDVTWWEYPGFLCAALENDLGVICACIPTLRPLWPHVFGGPINVLTAKIKSWSSSKSSSAEPSANRSPNQTNAQDTVSPALRVWPSPKVRPRPLSRSVDHFGVLEDANGSSGDDINLVIQTHGSREGLNQTSRLFNEVDKRDPPIHSEMHVSEESLNQESKQWGIKMRDVEKSDPAIHRGFSSFDAS
ncbi:hypothetical protein EJ08DRAFT_696058 [Tothia fuscella]|uniref:Rhodopsin domain-containing protein n=1 Tax=Tothia fuscella TaxID=1048955 RepID=A0A9P4NUF0_9PEZI|nr:hypothetical protein EJ08DRAFT_696058 [Tothia fuscella]